MKQELVQKQKLPDGWNIKRLWEISEIIMGQSPDSNTYNNKKIGLPFYQGKANFGELNPIPTMWCSRPKKIAKKDDILLSVRAPVGPTNICTEESCIGRGLAAIRTNSSTNYKYIFYLLQAFGNKLKENATGSTFEAITIQKLKNITLPVPSLSIQQRIVSKLDVQMAQIEIMKKEAEKEKEASEEIFQSFIETIYGKIPNKKSLKSLCLETNTRNPQKEPNKIFDYIDISSVDNNKKNIIKSKKILGKDAPSRARKVILDGDIILSTTRPNLNAVAMVPSELNNQIASTGFCVIRTSKDLNNEYLFYYAQSAKFVNKLSDLVKGALYPAVTDKQVLAQEIPFTNINNQIEITKKVKQVFNLSQSINIEIEQKLSAISLLPSSILNEVFGKYEISNS